MPQAPASRDIQPALRPSPVLPPPRRVMWRRRLINSFIALYLCMIFIDTLPLRLHFTNTLRDRLDPVLDATGLWQGSWKLFAPNVGKENSYIEARLHYSDGTTWTWTSTSWDDKGPWEIFFYVRHMKLWDLYRSNDHRVAWPALVDWVVRQAPERAGARPARVELYRHWWRAAGPAEASWRWRDHTRIPPPRDEFAHAYRFYSTELP